MGGGQSKLLATFDGFRCLETLKVSKSSTENKKGFTLAEVLITLGIIGVVSAITMPMLITNVRNQVRAKRIENIEQKFSKATDKMVALGVYTGLGSTENFVNELGKHLKLAKVCDNDNLQSCWPYEKVITRKSGTTWDIANTKLASELKMKDDDYSEWDKTMGIITADGTSMILSYNKKCDIDETKSINYSGSISSTTGCVAVVYDWNGATKPNKYGDDVLSINAKGLHNSCGAIEIGNDLCFSAVTYSKPMTLSECQEALKNKKYNIPWCAYEKDYYLGAIRDCKDLNNLPTYNQLVKLAKEFYKDNKFDYNSETAKLLKIVPVTNIWARDNSLAQGSFIYYYENNYGGALGFSNNNYAGTLCIAD